MNDTAIKELVLLSLHTSSSVVHIKITVNIQMIVKMLQYR